MDNFILSYEKEGEGFLFDGSPTLERLKGYYTALAGLKMQARVASLGLAQKDLVVDRDELKSAHKLMSDNIKEVNEIVKIVGRLNTTVPEFTEDKLKSWLIDNDLYFSHLKLEPTYYSCCNIIDCREYYFITKYFDDGESFGGHSNSIDEVRDMQNSLIEHEKISVNLVHTPLINTLAFPELCSDVYIAVK